MQEAYNEQDNEGPLNIRRWFKLRSGGADRFRRCIGNRQRKGPENCLRLRRRHGENGENMRRCNGGLHVIGLKYGHTKGNDIESKEKTYALVREFCRLFSKKHGSVECRELLPCDISTPEGLELALEQKIFRTLCPKYVESAVRILEKTIIG